MTGRKASLALGTAALLALGVPRAATALGEARAELVATGLTQPLYVTAPAGDARLFVVERAGRIRIVSGGSPTATPFLDIHTKVSDITSGGEGGLLGLAFPPDYAESHLFYVYYTNLEFDSVVSRFSLLGPNRADPDSEEEVLFIDQPGFTNHKGGTIQFGPDGFLWFATGDGGGSDDPDELAQNQQSLLGKMLRIDPGPVFAPGSVPVPGENYAIPGDNPFRALPPRDEIWARGLRNPYRWSFDRETGDIWIGDVGQSAREEVDFEPFGIPGGRNYGWDVMEGTACGAEPAPPPPACNAPSLRRPIYDYGRAAGDCTVIGGYVFRSGVTPITGLYFFGDFCTGNVWSLDPQSPGVVDRTAELAPAAGPNFTLVGFGEDGSGRLLLVQQNQGAIYRIVSADPACGDGLDNDADGLADFPADPGCQNTSGAREDPQCDDGVDNDGDGAVDWDGGGVSTADPQCSQGWVANEGTAGSIPGCGIGPELAVVLGALWLLVSRRSPARSSSSR